MTERVNPVLFQSRFPDKSDRHGPLADSVNPVFGPCAPMAGLGLRTYVHRSQ